jgi:hypothetical protein
MFFEIDLASHPLIEQYLQNMKLDVIRSGETAEIRVVPNKDFLKKSKRQKERKDDSDKEEIRVRHIENEQETESPDLSDNSMEISPEDVF